MPPSCLLAAVSLLALGCHVGVAVPDDGQVLIQRAAVLQQEDSDGGGELVANRDLLTATAIAGATNVVTELRKKLGNRSIGMNREICTEQQLHEYLDKKKLYEEKQRQMTEKFYQDLSNKTQQVWQRHLEPFNDAFSNITKAMDPVLRPILRDLLKYHMVQLYKPSQPYKAADVVKDLQQIATDLQNAVQSQGGTVKEILAEGLRQADLLLNETMDGLPGSDRLRKIFGVGPPKGGSPEELSKYLLGKALPLISLEFFPNFAKLLAAFSSMPKDDVITWIWSEVWPAARESLNGTEDVWRQWASVQEEVPKRFCVTCQEKYEAMVSDLDGGCIVSCAEVFGACLPSVDGGCLLAGKRCIMCHTSFLAELDTCTGTDTNGAAIASWNGIALALGNATTPEGFDKLLDDLSHKLAGS